MAWLSASDVDGSNPMEGHALNGQGLGVAVRLTDGREVRMARDTSGRGVAIGRDEVVVESGAGAVGLSGGSTVEWSVRPGGHPRC